MREKFAKFMAGRYGNDQLNRLLLVCSMVMMLLAVIFNHTTFSTVMWDIAVIVLVLVYIRMLSRNVYKRSDENNRYMRFRYKIGSKFRVTKERWVQRKDYKFFTCPSCHTTLRVPKGKGSINVVCRKCGNSFRGKT